MTDKTYLSISEVQTYLGIGRTALYQLRLERKYARANKDTAFAAEYEINGRVRFRRDEIDAWMSGRACAVGRRNARPSTPDSAVAPKLHPNA